MPRGCVNRIRIWPLRRNEHSGVLIGAGGTRRSDCGARVLANELSTRIGRWLKRDERSIARVKGQVAASCYGFHTSTALIIKLNAFSRIIQSGASFPPNGYDIPTPVLKLVKGIRVLVDSASSPSTKRTDAAKRLIFMIRRPLKNLSKLYGARVHTYPENGMPVRSPNLVSDICHLVSRLVTGLRSVPKDERHLRLDLHYSQQGRVCAGLIVILQIRT